MNTMNWLCITGLDDHGSDSEPTFSGSVVIDHGNPIYAPVN